MPTYAYACEQCGHKFEAFQSITAKSMRKCPACGRASLKRLIGSGAGIIFKGSGFYCTDYRSDSYTAAAKKESGGTTAPSKTGDKKETKTEPASPPAAAASEPTAKKKRSA
jgi:putative FmdB family regulatory protein